MWRETEKVKRVWYSRSNKLHLARLARTTDAVGSTKRQLTTIIIMEMPFFVLCKDKQCGNRMN